MSYVNVEVHETGQNVIDRVNKILAGFPSGAIKASYAALKRAGETAKTKSGQFAAAKYTISKGTFMANSLIKATASGDSGGVASLELTFIGSPLPLLTFRTRYSRDGKLTAQVLRNSAGAGLERAFVSRTFGLSVARRLGNERYPLETLFGPGTSKMMGNEEIVEQMDKTIRETFENRIEHEILRVLSGW